MRIVILFLTVIIVSSSAFSQQRETFDITSFVAPAGWQKEAKDFAVSYLTTNNMTGGWCRVSVYKSIRSSGNSVTDFNSEWGYLIAKSFPDAVLPAPQATTEGGWTSQSGVAKMIFDKKDAVSMLTTVTGYDVAVSIVVLMNNNEFMPAVEKFLASIDLQKPTVSPNTVPQTQPEKSTNTISNVARTNSKFTFNTTNFDNGWTSTEQEDWVQVTKGPISVLIHYPNTAADAYNSSLMEGLKNAWNILVAPRYSSATNFEFKPVSGWQPISFAEADLIENATSKKVHVVLFKMHYSGGDGKYLEFVTPDKKTFELEFGAYHQESYGWEKMEVMASYNKFAVAPADLVGKWTNNFSGLTQYVYANTGLSAGADTHSSAQNFQFFINTYNWDLAVANGPVGNIKFQTVKSKGTYSMPNNWQINFSDLEGKPKTYNAYFSCIKGGARILWLQDTGYGGYSGYGKMP